MCQEEKLLLLKTIDSDETAFKELFLNYQPVLYNFICFKTTNSSLAQDLVQETFVKVWLNRSSLKPDLSFFSYLVKICNNLLKDHFKYLDVRERHEDSVPHIQPSLFDNPENALEYSLLHDEILLVANNYFSDTCRTIFFLSRIEQKSNLEIADMLDIPRKKVENHLYKALQSLRKNLTHLPSQE
jgi:RNA polymerase sigma factor (sigma-70 family)